MEITLTKKKILFSAFLLFIICSSVFAQNYTCDYCKEKIKSRYVRVENKYFHAEHFLCAACKKVIRGSYTKENGNYYHPECYTEKFVDKCNVCGEPLIGEYVIDLFNNKYHSSHQTEFNSCDNCKRLICDKITHGGKRLNDGRTLCNICLDDAVKSADTYSFLLRKVADKIRAIGLNVNLENVSVRSVDRDGLRSAAGKSYNPNLQGFCKIDTESGSSKGRKYEKVEYTIYVLNKVPSLYTETTIAHELMHIWFNQNTKNNHSDELTEGSCHYISYLYLNGNNSETAAFIKKSFMEDLNPVYGGGLRKVAEKFKNRYLSELLNYLRTNTSI